MKDNKKTVAEMMRFAISGVAGFSVDAGIVVICTSILGLSPIPAQLLGFAVAVTVTWIINRNWTFSERASDRWIHEWVRYVVANSFGAAVNNIVYAILVLGLAVFSKTPLLAVAIGSIAGIGFNFVASKKLIFTMPQQ